MLVFRPFCEECVEKCAKYVCAAALVWDSFSEDFEAQLAHNAYHFFVFERVSRGYLKRLNQSLVEEVMVVLQRLRGSVT